MAGVKLNHVYKVYDNGVKAVNDFCIDIKDKEFIVFVGPSGCGKSTTLRMIAGLEDITSGELYIDDHLVNEVEPQDRDIAMVFQNYALYPHMTVFDNMAFALKNAKVPRAEIEERVHGAAKILGLEEYLDRKPKEMSGGQRQRVALGRAIVRNPKVFLLDEPLSNLDAKLRASMRTEISKIHRKLETTFIYVTHDQVEAMTMGTRIVVMKDGFVQQIDTPINLFNYPVNKFVAGFIGTPQMNFFNVTLKKRDDNLDICFGNQYVSVPYINYARLDSRYLDNEKEIILGVRPDHILLSKEETPLKVRVALIEQLGIESILYGDLMSENGENQPIVVKIPQGEMFNPNDIVYVTFNEEWLHLFDKDSEESICLKEPVNNYVKASVKDGKISLFGKCVELPPVLKHIENKNLIALIPTDAIIDGKDFSMKPVQTRYDGNGFITLKSGDEYVTTKCFVSNSKTFSVNWSRITLLHGDEVVANGCPNELTLTVNLKKIKAKRIVKIHKKKNVKTEHGLEIRDNVIEKEKNVTLFMYDLFGKEQEIDYKESTKLLDIFGRHVTKNSFEVRVDINSVKKGTIYSFPVKEIVDYGNNKVIKFEYNGVDHLIPIEASDSLVQFDIDLKNISLYEKTSQIKIF